MKNPVFSIDDEVKDFNNVSVEKNVFAIEENLPNTNSSIIKKEEKWKKTSLEIVIPFFISGLGMVCAGILFGEVERWEVFQNVREIIVLVPALLDLKGNLDMSLASRLSTQLNLGVIHNKETTIKALIGNLVLKLLQAIVVGFLASFMACITEYILDGQVTLDNLLILIASSVTSAAVSSTVLGILVMSMIVISKKYNINPDNVATPVAGSVGDVGTLIILASFGTFFYRYRDAIYIHIIFILFFLLLIPFLIFYSKSNEFVNSTLKHGWLPIILSMFISSIAGLLLEVSTGNYNGIETFQPAVNGVGGNLVSIYSSRLSTEIARDPETHGKWAKWAPPKIYGYFYDTFFGGKNKEAKTARLLMCLVIPGHLIFFFIIYFVSKPSYQPGLTVWLVVFYILAACIQVLLLFIICYVMIHIIWRINKDPDDWCIPLLTSFGDIFGVSLLYLCFHLVYLTGDENLKITISPMTTIITMNNGMIFNQTSFN